MSKLAKWIVWTTISIIISFVGVSINSIIKSTSITQTIAIFFIIFSSIVEIVATIVIWTNENTPDVINKHK